MARNREGKKKRHLFLKFILAVLIFGAVGTVINRTGILEKSDPWPVSDLAEKLPKAEKGKFSVHQYGDSLSIDIKNVDETYFNTYVKACKEAGFTVEADSVVQNYEAFNAEGYKLELRYYQYSKQIDIRLEEPMKMKTLNWPDTELAQLVPVPESNRGNISTNRTDRLIVYVGDMPIDQFEQYILACREYGFTQNHNQGDTYYRAENADGIKLSLDYEGFNVVRIDLEKAKKTAENSSRQESSKPETSKEESVETSSQEASTEVSSTAPSGIRKEVKDFVDQYESFMNEYCEFLEAYDKSDLAAGLKYASMLKKYWDFVTKADAMDKTDFTYEEDQYFTQAMLRVNEKLARVAYKME